MPPSSQNIVCPYLITQPCRRSWCMILHLFLFDCIFFKIWHIHFWTGPIWTRLTPCSKHVLVLFPRHWHFFNLSLHAAICILSTWLHSKLYNLLQLNICGCFAQYLSVLFACLADVRPRQMQITKSVSENKFVEAPKNWDKIFTITWQPEVCCLEGVIFVTTPT